MNDIERAVQNELVHGPYVVPLSFTGPVTVPPGMWEPLGLSHGQDLIEFAGRTCYRSYHNPGHKTQGEYIQHLIRQGHESVLEHAVASFYIGNISRACSHELVRHRIASYSQTSQRYVDESNEPVVIHPAYYEDEYALQVLADVAKYTKDAYKRLLEHFDKKYAEVQDKTQRRKMARQAARMVLPNAVNTSLVMTANLREWRHFLKMRGSLHADAEIRQVAIWVHYYLSDTFPAVFQDIKTAKNKRGEIYLIYESSNSPQ